MTNWTIGKKIGKCRNCGADVEIRQPWLSTDPVVNDGYYLIHCKNEACHNYYGIELDLCENSYDRLCMDTFLDFVEKDDQFVNELKGNLQVQKPIDQLIEAIEDVRDAICGAIVRNSKTDNIVSFAEYNIIRMSPTS